jgi:GNAT superfamily N-acetyltransferase
MVVQVEHALPRDQVALERLIAAYHVSEGCSPRPERLREGIRQVLEKRVEGTILVGRQNEAIVGVVLGVCLLSTEVGRVLMIQDFFVEPISRRRGVGRALVNRLLKESRGMGVDEVNLEVLPANSVAAAFWKSMSFESTGEWCTGGA